jgi:cysteine synthase A
VPAVPYTDPNNFNHLAKSFAEKNENTVWTNQFDNVANKLAHYKTTGPEIWMQTEGKVDGFTCATGTGGTFAGIAQYLKEKNPNVKTYVADPPGSVLHPWYQRGVLERVGSSITEGIGQGRITANMEGAKVDGTLFIEDSKTIAMVYNLLNKEGIYLGASSCLNVVAAYELAKILGPGHNVVTILCDGAGRYASRLFSKKWLESKNLMSHIPNDSKYLVSLP